MNDYFAGYLNVISEEDVAKLVPKAFKVFREEMTKLSRASWDATLQGIAEAVEYVGDPDLDKIIEHWNLTDDEEDEEAVDERAYKVIKAFEALQAAFVRATTVLVRKDSHDRKPKRSHLTLNLAYFDPDELRRGGDVEAGVYWHTTGNQQLSPAGEKFERYINKEWFIAQSV